MIALLILLFLALLLGLRRRGKDDCAATWLNKETTTTLNGFWILVVFLSHANQYISRGGYQYTHFGDGVYRFFFGMCGQLMVAIFLFNSGFGVMESIKARGQSYVRSMPKRRLLATLLNFSVAVLAFIAMNIILGIPMKPLRVVLSFFCWDSVGNSNWYIFAILCCYASSFFGFTMCKKASDAITLSIGLLLLYLAVMPFLKASYWYNTILGFPTGMVVSWRKEHIFGFVQKHYWSCICLLGICFVLGMPLSWRVPLNGLSHNAITVVFVLISAVLLTKYDVMGGGLSWCGKRLFPIYIYERIPMTILADSLATHPIVFIVVSGAITAVVASVYKYWRVSFDRNMGWKKRDVGRGKCKPWNHAASEVLAQMRKEFKL